MSQPITGAPLDRADGRLKVTGAALYTGDRSLDGLVHAVVVPSTIANGRVGSIDERRARAVPGVIEIITHHNAMRVDASKSDPNESLLFLLQDDVVQFDRQPVAVVVAERFEQAVQAADLLHVRYHVETPTLDMERAPLSHPKEIFGEPATFQRGAPDDAYAAADARLRETYRTPTEHHNPMETHGTVAHWRHDRLTVYDSTQWVFGVQQRLAKIFGASPGNITVIAPFVGGAFGGKGQAWSHVPLAVMAAKMVDRPVKLLVTRPQMFGWVGHRPQTHQTVALGASRDGQLTAVSHAVVSETSVADEFVEPSAVFSRDLYATPNFGMSHALARLNIAKPTYQRGPGESTGSFALESAMDELAYALDLDPVELRLRNYSERNPSSGKPYTAKHLRECYERGSERFGWHARSPEPRSMRRGRMLVGMGMATASRATHRSGCNAKITLAPDGKIVVECGTIEQGTGSATVFGQLAAEILEVPFDRVTFAFGDTTLPKAPLAAGSQTAASVGSAVAVAAAELRDRIRAGAPIPPDGLTVVHEEQPPKSEDAFAQQSFGAHFAEVEVDPDIGTVRVTRFVGAFDGGRILNAKTARSQLLGGIVWGISMALFEKTRYDANTGRIMNASLADYLIPTNADIPDIDIVVVAADDPNANPAHLRGIGEVGIAGSAAAIANAVYHATGRRIRELPITLDQLIG